LNARMTMTREDDNIRKRIESTVQEVVGTSPALQRVLARAAKVAPTDSTVLISGKPGRARN
jgi:DNA-binding NtrC family response regulator